MKKYRLIAMTNATREYLIKALADGTFVSGQKLGCDLHISRAAISKQIKKLTTIGLDIYSVPGKGYKLSHSIDLLDKAKINSYISSNFDPSLIEVHNLIDSTNSYLLRRLPNQLKQEQVCLAEYQSAGRGRRGRRWESPFGSHVYLSMYWQLEQGFSAAMGLSLVTALAVSDAVNAVTGIAVELKWPNDVYIHGEKLAGILIDLEGPVEGPSHSVIGIGLNLSMPENSAKKIDQDWTDLQTHTTQKIDRNELSAQLIDCLKQRLVRFEKNGLVSMIDEWHTLDIYLNKKVSIITGHKSTRGICRGINSQGALLLEVDGKVKVIYGGEISLRGHHDSIN